MVSGVRALTVVIIIRFYHLIQSTFHIAMYFVATRLRVIGEKFSRSILPLSLCQIPPAIKSKGYNYSEGGISFEFYDNVSERSILAILHSHPVETFSMQSKQGFYIQIEDQVSQVTRICTTKSRFGGDL